MLRLVRLANIASVRVTDTSGGHVHRISYGVRAAVEETAQVQPWFIDVFGDPCRQCGYVWSSATLESALEQLAGAPARYSSLLAGTDGSQRHPALKWSAKAYVFHVADNLHIWTERPRVR